MDNNLAKNLHYNDLLMILFEEPLGRATELGNPSRRVGEVPSNRFGQDLTLISITMNMYQFNRASHQFNPPLIKAVGAPDGGLDHSTMLICSKESSHRGSIAGTGEKEL